MGAEHAPGVTDPDREEARGAARRRWILLVDMDAFFASVEQAHHPELRGKPVIVCGDPGRRGVVTAASYEARPFGVRAGMPLQEARGLCPSAVYVEGDPEKYVGISLQLLQLYLTYTPDVEPFSVDEAFVGLNPDVKTRESATTVARKIQADIDARFGLGASIGIGPNKLVAKMAAGAMKPRGLTAFDEERFRRHFWPLDIQEMWGIGPQLATRMRSLGFKTVGELARAPDPVLKDAFGIIGPQLREAAWGRDDTPLVPYHQGVDAKSAGHEVTLALDSDDPAYLEGVLLRLSDQVGRRIRGEGYAGRTVVLKLRNQRFETITRQRALSEYTDDHQLIYQTALSLFRSNWRGGRVRLIGVSLASLLRVSGAHQTELFSSERRLDRLIEAADQVRDKLGEAKLVPLGSLTHRRDMRHVPFGAMPRKARGRPALPPPRPEAT
jgi:DNA polymerase-4